MTESYNKLRNNTKTSSNDVYHLNGTSNNYKNEFSQLKLDNPKEMASLIEKCCVDFGIKNEESSDSDSVDSNTSKGIQLH